MLLICPGGGIYLRVSLLLICPDGCIYLRVSLCY